MTLPKFNVICSLMRAAKVTKLAHGFNAYFFIVIFMLKRSASPIFTKTPFTLQAKANLLNFIFGNVEARILMQSLQGVISLDIAPASGAAASEGPSEPGLSSAAKALPCEKIL